MSNLLEEAIVDAKALKEAALKSAQEAILEKYNPEVKKALQTILLEQEDEPLVNPDMDALGAPPAPTGGSLDGQIGLGATGGAQLCPCPDNDVLEIDIQALQKAMMSTDKETGMTNDMSQQLQPPLTPEAEPMAPAGAPPSPAETAPGTQSPPEMGTMSGTEETPGEEPPEELKEETVDEEIDLSEELLNSLLEDEELFEDFELEEKLIGKRKKLDVAEPKGKLTSADFAKLRSTKEKDLEEDARFQPSQSATEAIKDRKGTEPLRIAVRQKEAIMKKELAESKTVSLNEARQLAEKTSLLLEKHNNMLNENKLLVNENARLLKEHAEMQATALELSKQLEQLNVQNAKLYYKNQALSSVSLNERQKTKIVEAISKADSIDEVKIIFETLQSTVGSQTVKSEPQSLSEAVNKNIGFNIRSREKEQPTSAPAFDRWQKIAGIKK